MTIIDNTSNLQNILDVVSTLPEAGNGLPDGTIKVSVQVNFSMGIVNGVFYPDMGGTKEIYLFRNDHESHLGEYCIVAQTQSSNWRINQISNNTKGIYYDIEPAVGVGSNSFINGGATARVSTIDISEGDQIVINGAFD